MALVVTLAAGWLWALFFWVIAVFILQFFRDPPRAIPDATRAVLAPADGRIVAVERTRDPYLERDALKLSVFMNVFNVHSNRSPVDGIVREVRYHAGAASSNAALSKASARERAQCVVDKDGGRRRCHLRAGGGSDCAPYPVCYGSRRGDAVARGQRYGFHYRFGSRVDVYLPVSATPRVAIGDVVYASATILAELG